jgi:hypothetical protein
VVFKQFYLACLGHTSYLIGDKATGTAAVVDPQRDTDQDIALSGKGIQPVGFSWGAVVRGITKPHRLKACAT